MITREQQGTVLFTIALLTLFGIAELLAVDWLWQQYRTAEQASIQIQAPYSPPSKDTITWAGQ